MSTMSTTQIQEQINELQHKLNTLKTAECEKAKFGPTDWVFMVGVKENYFGFDLNDPVRIIKDHKDGDYWLVDQPGRKSTSMWSPYVSVRKDQVVLKARAEQIQVYLIDVCKELGIWNKPMYNTEGHIRDRDQYSEKYDIQKDSLISSYGRVYYNGTFANPLTTIITIGDYKCKRLENGVKLGCLHVPNNQFDILIRIIKDGGAASVFNFVRHLEKTRRPLKLLKQIRDLPVIEEHVKMIIDESGEQ
jgi:hypothetical protein